jgi:hypothetical protein
VDFTDERISELDEAVIAAVLEIVEHNVGRARLAEAFAIIIVANLARIVVLEQLYDNFITFQDERAFRPMIIVQDTDVA